MWWSTSSRMPTRWRCQRRPVTAVAPTCCRSTSARYTSLSLLVMLSLFTTFCHASLSCLGTPPGLSVESLTWQRTVEREPLWPFCYCITSACCTCVLPAYCCVFQGKTPLEDGETEHTGCVFCDPLFKTLVERHHAVMQRRSGGGRGRGRGGRGRGRRGGRGRGKPKDKMAQLAAYFV